jgi:hypothetical protein
MSPVEHCLGKPQGKLKMGINLTYSITQAWLPMLSTGLAKWVHVSLVGYGELHHVAVVIMPVLQDA